MNPIIQAVMYSLYHLSLKQNVRRWELSLSREHTIMISQHCAIPDSVLVITSGNYWHMAFRRGIHCWVSLTNSGFPSQMVMKLVVWCFFVLNLNDLLNKNSQVASDLRCLRSNRYHVESEPPELVWTCRTQQWLDQHIRLEGPEDPHRRNSRFLRSRDHAHASIPLAQTAWDLTGRAWLQAGAQRVVMVVSHH